MNIRHCSGCCKLLTAWLCLAAWLAGDVGAQNEGLSIAKVEGKLEAVKGYQMKVKPEKGESVMVTINPSKTDFDYSGTAEMGFLVPGLMVRFTASFDAAGKAQDALKELEIFNPARKRRMTAEYMRDQTAGIHPIEANAGAAGGQKGNQGGNRPSAPGGGVADGTDFRIVGKLMAVQGNTIQVAAGARPIMVQVDKDVKITVVAGDATFCQPGDKVEVTGLSNAANRGLIEAEKLTVTGGKTLTLAKPGAQVRESRSRRGKQDEADAKGAPKPAAGSRDRNAVGS
jgi:hypothetical protein